jgi:hypothetical protein
VRAGEAAAAVQAVDAVAQAVDAVEDQDSPAPRLAPADAGAEAEGVALRQARQERPAMHPPGLRSVK